MSHKDDLISAIAAAKKARAAIDHCPHDFVEGEIKTEAYTIDLGESIGTSSSWVLVQYRHCRTCGVRQRKIQFAPDRKFGEWEEVQN